MLVFVDSLFFLFLTSKKESNSEPEDKQEEQDHEGQEGEQANCESMDIDDSHQSELMRKRMANMEEHEIFFAKQGLPVSKIWKQSYIPLWKKSVNSCGRREISQATKVLFS